MPTPALRQGFPGATPHFSPLPWVCPGTPNSGSLTIVCHVRPETAHLTHPDPGSRMAPAPLDCTPDKAAEVQGDLPQVYNQVQ